MREPAQFTSSFLGRAAGWATVISVGTFPQKGHAPLALPSKVNEKSTGGLRQGCGWDSLNTAGSATHTMQRPQMEGGAAAESGKFYQKTAHTGQVAGYFLRKPNLWRLTTGPDIPTIN